MIAIAMPTRRDLFITLDMLRAEGLNVWLRLREGSVEVGLDDHAAVFRSPEDLRIAANWLAERALMHCPDSAFVQLWLTLARAAGAPHVTQND